MKTIYLVCETVDLGYDVICAYDNKERAIDNAAELEKEYRIGQKAALMNSTLKYSEADADQWLADHGNQYFVELTDLYEDDDAETV